MRHRPLIRIALAAGVSLLLLGACKDEQRNAYVAPPPPAVTVAAPEVRAVTEYIELTGTTSAVATVQLVARVEGFLEQIHFQDGQRVKHGDLLFTIQQDTYQAQLQQAQSEVGSVQARLEQAQTEFARYSGLFKQKAASAVDVDTWRANLDGAQADLLGAQAKVALAQINLGYTTVTAPFDGRMGRHLIDAGNLVGPGGAGTVLAEINRIDPIYAYFTINERDLLRIRGERRQGVGAGGQPVDQVLQLGVANEDGFPHAGKLDFAAIALTAGTGTLQLRGIFPNPDYQLLPGLFARIRAPIGGRAGAVLVPETVIGRDQSGTYVLTVDKDDVVHRTGVELGQLVGTERVVASGLTADARVVIDGLQRAVPGGKVTPRESAAAAPAPVKPAG
jgi:RND family efflux transporter MFP subunit